MDKVNRKFSNKFGSHWIGIKLYSSKPDLKNIKQTNFTEFSKALKKAVVEPILIKIKDSTKKSLKYIGLNTDAAPDKLISYLTPEQVMKLIKAYDSDKVSVCANLNVEDITSNKLCLSFGCDNSRKFAQLSRDVLAVSVPRKLFNLFV